MDNTELLKTLILNITTEKDNLTAERDRLAEQIDNMNKKIVQMGENLYSLNRILGEISTKEGVKG